MAATAATWRSTRCAPASLLDDRRPRRDRDDRTPRRRTGGGVGQAFARVLSERAARGSDVSDSIAADRPDSIHETLPSWSDSGSARDTALRDVHFMSASGGSAFAMTAFARPPIAKCASPLCRIDPDTVKRGGVSAG
jgi:hypothetical protein